MKISAHNVIKLDMPNRNGRLYSKEEVMKCIGTCANQIPVVYYPAEVSEDFNDSAWDEWGKGIPIGSGTLLYDELENVYNFTGEVADDAATKLLPYLTIRCLCGSGRVVDGIDIVEDISALEVYISRDSSFTDEPNIEVIDGDSLLR